MTRKNVIKENSKRVALDEGEVKNVLVEQKDFLVPMVQEAMQTVLEMEMAECLQAVRYERSEERTGYRSGYYRRRLVTRVGTISLRVPQDRSGHFSTQVFEQYQRSEKA
jgi:putative transposase